MSLNLKFKFRLKLKNQGVTLIELLIALVISAILIVALYRIFIGQQKTYTVQEQVVDMQQNVRVAINKMMREIRMAGFGNIGDLLNLSDGVNGFTRVITPANDKITIVGGYKQIRRDNGDPITVDSASGNTVTLNYTPEPEEFNSAAKRFISIGGGESSKFQINGKVLTLDNEMKQSHPKGTPIFKIQAVTYTLGFSGGKTVLQRNENTGGGGQPFAENMESLQFEYFDENGKLTASPEKIRMVRVTIAARTNLSDPEYKSDGGFRKREISSNIQIRNPLTP